MLDIKAIENCFWESACKINDTYNRFDYEKSHPNLCSWMLSIRKLYG